MTGLLHKLLALALLGSTSHAQTLMQGEAATLVVGPFVDATDGVTPETGLTISQADVQLSLNGATLAQKDDATSATHDANGFYRVPIAATDVSAPGKLLVTIQEAGALPYFREFTVEGVTLSDLQSQIAGVNSGGGALVLASGAGTGVDDLLGSWPVVGTASYVREVNAVVDAWLAICPVDKGTTYYFDASGGSDANDGLSESQPKQTVSAMNAVLAGARVTVRAKGAWRTETTVSLDDDTLTNWPGEAWPRFTGCRLTIAASSAAWTNASGDRWTATLANASHIRPQSWDVFRELSLAADATECGATDNSYFIDSGTVHVNLAGTDPNTLAWEANHVDDYGSGADGVLVTGGGCRVENVICDHNGYAGAQTGTNQSYGVRFENEGEEVAVGRNLVCAGHRYHNLGTNPVQAGGRTLIDSCRVGGCRDEAATHINFYSGNGGNQAIARGCTIVNDRTPAVGMNAENSQYGFFGHTTSNSIEFVAVLGSGLSEDADDPPQSLGRLSNLPPDGDQIGNVRGAFVGCVTTATPASRTVPCLGDHAFVNCDFRIKPASDTTLGLTGLNPGGWMIGTRWEVDCSDLPTSGVYGVFTAGTRGNLHLINSHVRFRDVPSGLGFMFFRSSSSVNDWDLAHTLINTVFEADGEGTAYIGLGDTNSDQTNVANNAVYGFTQEVTGERGYSTWPGTVELDHGVSMDTADVRLLGAGDTTLGLLCEVDGRGEPLSRPGSQIGPWGDTTVTLDTLTTPALTDTQSQLLAATATQASVDALPTPLDAAGTRAALGMASADLDDQFGSIEVGGAQPVRPRVIHAARVWSYDPLRSGKRPVDLVEVGVGFEGDLAFEPPLNPGSGVKSVTSVTVGGSATGLSNLGPSADGDQAVFTVAAGTIAAGKHEVEATIVTTDGQTLPLAATLRVD